LTPGISFRAKVVLLLCGVVLLLGMVAVVQARNDMRRILGAELERRGQAIAQDLAANSVDPLLTGDLFGLYDLVNRTKVHNPDVRYILVIAPMGKVQANTFGEGTPQGLVEANPLAQGRPPQLRRLRTEEGLIRDIAAPILGGKAGVVRVGMSDQSVEAAVARNTKSLALLVALAVLLGLILSYWLAYYLTRPLSHLVEAVQSVAQGSLSQRIPSPGSDEVGQVGKAFNMMTEALAQKEAARRALLEKVISSQEEERKRVARELHDELAQRLTSVLLSLETIETSLGDSEERTKQALQHAGEMVGGSLAETRRLIGDLRPSVLDDLGLVPALRSYAEAHLRPVKCEVNVVTANVPAELPPAVETAVFRVVQEAINNIAKHSGARLARIDLRQEEGCLRGEIRDDGCGFWTDKVKAGALESRGLGLRGMQERAALLGGSLSVQSEPGRGTRVAFDIPLHWGDGGGNGKDQTSAGG